MKRQYAPQSIDLDNLGPGRYMFHLTDRTVVGKEKLLDIDKILEIRRYFKENPSTNTKGFAKKFKTTHDMMHRILTGQVATAKIKRAENLGPLDNVCLLTVAKMNGNTSRLKV